MRSARKGVDKAVSIIICSWHTIIRVSEMRCHPVIWRKAAAADVMVTNLTYGRRGKKQQLERGTREVSPTFGRTRTPISTRRFGKGSPYLVDGRAEQLAARILDIEPEVVSFRPQGVTVDLVEGRLLYTAEEVNAARSRYSGQKGPQLYTADFLTDLSSARQSAIEVKLDTYLGDDEYTEKLRLASHVLGRMGIEFYRVVFPEDPCHPVWSNVPLIRNAMYHKDLWPREQLTQQIEEIADRGIRTAAEFMRALGMEMKFLSVLIAAGALKADLLASHLKGDTHVEACYGDMEHLKLIGRFLK